MPTTKQQRLLDVWLLDLNEVYTQVPFTVVAEWLQQGRLLAEDRVRVAGNQKWHVVSAVPALAPYLPQAEARPDDRAEALEAVDLGLHWKGKHEEEDEDVDMIPLIDISLVLLIFFMMTASVSSGMFTPIQTPAAKSRVEEIGTGMYWVGVETKTQGGVVEKGENGRPLPVYSLGKDQQTRVPPTRNLDEVMGALADDLKESQGEVRVRIRAERTLPIEEVRQVTADLQGLEARLNRGRGQGQGKVSLTLLGEVSQPQSP